MVGKPLSSRTSHILVSALTQEIGISALLTVALHTIIFAWLKNKVGSHLVRPVRCLHTTLYTSSHIFPMLQCYHASCDGHTLDVYTKRSRHMLDCHPEPARRL